MLDRLREDGAKAIAFDVQFTEPTTPRDDNALIDAVGAHEERRPRDDRGRRQRATPRSSAATRCCAAIGAQAGNALLPNDSGGTIRRTWYDARRLKTLGIATAEDVLRQADPALGARAARRAWIDYRGAPGTIPTMSYSDVLNGNFRTGTFRDRTSSIGPAAPSLGTSTPPRSPART